MDPCYTCTRVHIHTNNNVEESFFVDNQEEYYLSWGLYLQIYPPQLFLLPLVYHPALVVVRMEPNKAVARKMDTSRTEAWNEALFALSQSSYPQHFYFYPQLRIPTLAQHRPRYRNKPDFALLRARPIVRFQKSAARVEDADVGFQRETCDSFSCSSAVCYSDPSCHPA